MSTETAAHADEHGHGHDHEEDGAVHAHISDWKFLWAIFGALIVLTVVTVAVSYVDLGAANTAVAIAVATVKASLVATFFMHLRHDRPFNAIIFVSAFIFLGIFLFLTSEDLTTRTAVDRNNGSTVYDRNGELAPGGFHPVPVPVPAATTPAAGHTEPAHGEHH